MFHEPTQKFLRAPIPEPRLNVLHSSVTNFFNALCGIWHQQKRRGITENSRAQVSRVYFSCDYGDSMKGASSSGNNFFPSSLLCILIFMSIFNRRFCELFSFFPGFLKITMSYK